MQVVGGIGVLVAVLGLIVWGRVPDVAVTVPAALLVVALGLVGLEDLLETLDRLAPTLGFLAAIFVVAEIARVAGLFDALGVQLGRRAGSGRSLVLLVSAAAIGVTACMSLDATAVFLTPVVIHMVRARGSDGGPPLLATAQLANASSSARARRAGRVATVAARLVRAPRARCDRGVARGVLRDVGGRR